MISSTILRSGVVAVGTLTATVLAVSAAQAHGGDSEPSHRNPGMERMHELHMQDRHNMHAMDMRRHDR